ncbi:MAG: hypothetical protein Q8L93_06565, partial [Rhodocyclaceae bacterium]|nr:hypothetical protein [Rhodocyclaceae bacterium]
ADTGCGQRLDRAGRDGIGAVKKYAASGIDPPAALALRQNYEQIVMEQDMLAWMETLKARHEVTINKKLLESKER